MRQLVYQVCYTRYHVSFYLWLIGSSLKHCKVPKYYDQDCSVLSVASSIHSPVFSVQSLASSVQSSASRVQRQKSSVQSPASRVQRPEPSVQLLPPESRNSGMPVHTLRFIVYINPVFSVPSLFISIIFIRYQISLLPWYYISV